MSANVPTVLGVNSPAVPADLSAIASQSVQSLTTILRRNNPFAQVNVEALPAQRTTGRVRITVIGPRMKLTLAVLLQRPDLQLVDLLVGKGHLESVATLTYDLLPV